MSRPSMFQMPPRPADPAGDAPPSDGSRRKPSWTDVPFAVPTGNGIRVYPPNGPEEGFSWPEWEAMFGYGYGDNYPAINQPGWRPSEEAVSYLPPEMQSQYSPPEVRLESGVESRTDGAPDTTLPGYEDAVDAVAARMLEDAGLPTTPEYKREMRAKAESYVQNDLNEARARRFGPKEGPQPESPGQMGPPLPPGPAPSARPAGPMASPPPPGMSPYGPGTDADAASRLQAASVPPASSEDVAAFMARPGAASIDGPAVAPSVLPEAESQALAQSQVDARNRRNEYNERTNDVTLRRLARRAGISMTEARQIYNQDRIAAGGVAPTAEEVAGVPGVRIDGPPVASPATGPQTYEQRLASLQRLRDLGADRLLADERARQSRVSQHARLAGGQPTGGIGGSRAAVEWMNEGWGRTDALLARLSQEGISDWERAGIMAQLAPNADTANPTPLGVQAVGAQNAMRMMNAEALAGQDPFRREMATRQMDMQQRQQFPDLAGQQDIANGNFETPEAVAHLDRLAERHDTTDGGFSVDNERRLSRTLQGPPYYMPPAEADAKAYELAERRRWLSGGAPAGQGGGASAGPAMPPAANPAAPPRRQTPQGRRPGGADNPPPPPRPDGPRGRGAAGTRPRR